MKHKIYLLFVSTFFLSGITSLILSSIATAAVPQGYIKNANGKCLTSKPGQVKNNPVQLDECQDNASRQWQLPGDGTIRAQGMCLAVKNASKQSEAPVQIEKCNSGTHQQWALKDNGAIVNPVSVLCLDNKFNRIDNGNPIQIYYCNGTTAQQWSVPKAIVNPPVDEAFERPFSQDSPWKAPIPSNVKLDQHNASIVNELTKAGSPAAALVHEFAIPVYNANIATGTKKVTCTKPWGTCPFEGKNIPLSVAMKPHRGSDEAMVVVDMVSRQTAEFWQFKWNGGRPTTSWGAMLPIDGNGVGGSSVGAGVSRLAGLVRLSDVERKSIDHALVFSTNLCRSDTYRFPASKTDGKAGHGNETIEEGARVQLDPTINLDTIPNISPIEKMIGKALQRYGAYAIDCGGAKMAISFELDTKNPDVVSPAYQNAGIRWDYDNMPNIPWQKLRILKSWDGQ